MQGHTCLLGVLSMNIIRENVTASHPVHAFRTLCLFRFSLPYKHLLPSEEAASAGDMWNCEMSMLDVDKRGWMLGPMYNMRTGQLMVSSHSTTHLLC